ncbi:carbohydrate kinase family protein [Patescibacteria group bacterium]|nr:carbohydrate kinase family protein [Patescibacteria group bacterium]MBU1673225.1 carbohydrate kinase family protein [Patescibacteria group bacterium]MBU1964017.1 carbohydrate kinase family protein [Patescibacteria group bacterium]
MRRIFVSGSLAYDRIMNFPGYFKDNIMPDKIHVLNVSFPIERIEERFGGTAGNIAFNLSLFGQEATVLGTIGKDFDKYRNWLETHKIDLSKIKKVNNELTPTAHIITDDADNQIAGFYMGAMATPSKQKINGDENDIAIIAPGNLDDMIHYKDAYLDQKIPYLFDPGQMLTYLDKDQLNSLILSAKAFFSNGYELELTKKKTGLKLEEIQNACEIVVTTNSEEGSIIRTKDEEIKIPAVKPKKVTDPTGAGDAYRAGFIHGLTNGKDLKTCGQLGSLTATYAVEEYGTQEHFFEIDEFKNRYKESFKQDI